MGSALKNLRDAEEELAELEQAHSLGHLRGIPHAAARARDILAERVKRARAAYEAAQPRYTIEDMLVTEDRTGVTLEVDSPAHERRYVVELKFDPMADDRMAMVKHCENDGEGCEWQTSELPPHEVRELERWLECDADAVRMIENEWAEQRMLWNRGRQDVRGRLMDKLAWALHRLQCRRAAYAAAEEMLHSPQQRRAKHLERHKRYLDEAMEEYRTLYAQVMEPDRDAYVLCSWADSRGCNGEELTPEVTMREVRDGENVELVCAKCWALGQADAEDEAERPLCREDEGIV